MIFFLVLAFNKLVSEYIEVLDGLVGVLDGYPFDAEIDVDPYLLGEMPDAVGHFPIPLSLCPLAQFVPKSVVVLHCFMVIFLIVKHRLGDVFVVCDGGEGELFEVIFKFSDVGSDDKKFRLCVVMFLF